MSLDVVSFVRLCAQVCIATSVLRSCLCDAVCDKEGQQAPELFKSVCILSRLPSCSLHVPRGHIDSIALDRS